MLITKRTFMAGVGVAAIAAFAPVFGTDEEFNPNLRIRRKFSSPEAKADVAALAKGLRIMRKRTDFLSLENQRVIHAGHYRQHGCWRFFPWHRAQLANFEAIIAELSGRANFALPYWDAQEDRVLPKALLTPGSPFYIAGRTATEKTDYAAERWNFSSVGALMMEDGFDIFVGKKDAAGRVEGYGHNAVHAITGGQMGNVSTAPLDPLFWLHHCNVDRVWASWHFTMKPEYPKAWQQEEIGDFVGPKGPVPKTIAGAVIDMNALGYSYDQAFLGPVFAAAQEMPAGKSRLEIAGEDHYSASATICGQGRKISLHIPDQAVAALRADENELLIIECSGVVRYATEGLAHRVITITASAAEAGKAGTAPDVSETLASAAAFFHEADTKTPSGAHLMDQETYAQVYAFRDEIRDIVTHSEGPVTLTCDTLPVTGPDTAVPPVPVALDLDMKFIRRVWI
jgi:Common central domain of tyrosinase